MKPAPFAYAAPESVAQVLRLLELHGEEGKILAGGQSLIPLMNLRLAQPSVLIDLGAVRPLRYIRVEDGLIRIGAMTTQADVEESRELEVVCPLLPELSSLVGHLQIRTRGTIGGSLAHADPAAEIPMGLAALSARVRIASTAGVREMDAKAFVQGFLTTALEASELLQEIIVPVPPSGHGYSVQEVARRHGDFAIVAVACVVEPERGARVALGGVADTPVLLELPLSGDAAVDASRLTALARDSISPTDDVHATADYRRDVAGELVSRALREALDRMAGT
ncbi:MAG TPA: xanthine dehydrogenase family protein subunit M [Candidatus Saccharimonadales bacterium]|nr:xanthine dehydrogenase family protein subunit M [Candidatus Saccharimonadales bacterium]